MTSSASRVAIYARRSQKDDDKVRSIREQVERCTKFAHGIGGSVVKVYEELGSGLTAENRPIFLGMVKDAQAHRFDVLVVLDVSRFGRTEEDEAAYWRHTLKLAKVSVRFVLEDESLRGPAGAIMAVVHQGAARDQSRKTSDKSTAGVAAILREGFWHGGIPFGYGIQRRPDWNGRGRSGGKLVLVEHEAAIARRIFDRALAGAGQNVIARELNEAGLPTRKGRPWLPETVETMLTNPVYRGASVHGAPERKGTRGRRPATFNRLSVDGPVTVENAAAVQAIVVEGAVPAIVTPAEWTRVQELVEERRRTRSGGKTSLLSSRLTCRACGGTMQIASHTVGGKRWSYYKCTSAKRGRSTSKPECWLVTVRRDALDQAVLSAIGDEVESWSEKTVEDEVRAELSGEEDEAEEVDVPKLERKRRELRKRVAGLVVNAGNTELAEEIMRRANAEDAVLLAEINRAKAAKAPSPVLDLELVRESIKGVRDFRSLAKAASEGGDEEREALRGVVHKFVHKLEVASAPRGTPKGVRLHLVTAAGFALGTGETTLAPRSGTKRVKVLELAV